MSDALKIWDSFADLGKWGRLIAVLGPMAWALGSYEEARRQDVNDIKLSVQTIVDDVKAQVVIEDNHYTVLAARVSSLENHRDLDQRDVTIMSARIEGLKAQSDQTLVGVTELRDWIMQHPPGVRR